MNNKNIKKIRDLEWEEVFLFWYMNEGQSEYWIELAKERGFDSWADWRLSYTGPCDCANTEWGLYEISNPEKVISGFYGGPFKTWIENVYDGERKKSFKEIAKSKIVINNSKINEIVNNFSLDNTIIALQVKEKIYVIEGMHRCCALALMAEQNKQVSKKIRVAIGISLLDEIPIVGRIKKAT